MKKAVDDGWRGWFSQDRGQTWDNLAEAKWCSKAAVFATGVSRHAKIKWKERRLTS